MIYYDNSDEKDLKVGIVFDSPQDAVSQIAAMLFDVVEATCNTYLHGKRQNEIATLVTEAVLNAYNEK